MSDLSFNYFAHGRHLASDIELYPLTQCSPTIISAQVLPNQTPPPTITIRAGEVSSEGISGGYFGLMYCHSVPGSLWLRIPGIARFLLQDGNLITYQLEMPINGLHQVADLQRQRELSLFIQSHGIPYALLQSGALVARASAIRIGDKCTLLMSGPSEGKTTLASAFNKFGYTAVSDDFCVIEHGKVLPGYPYLKVWRDLFKFLEIEDGTLTRVRESVQRYFFMLEKHSTIPQQGLLLSDILIISSNFISEIEHEPITGIAKLDRVKSGLFRPGVRTRIATSQAEFELVSLMSKVNAYRVTRPHRGVKLRAQVDSILKLTRQLSK